MTSWLTQGTAFHKQPWQLCPHTGSAWHGDISATEVWGRGQSGAACAYIWSSPLTRWERGPEESGTPGDRGGSICGGGSDGECLKSCPWLTRFSAQLTQTTPWSISQSLLKSTGSRQDFTIHIITMKCLYWRQPFKWFRQNVPQTSGHGCILRVGLSCSCWPQWQAAQRHTFVPLNLLENHFKMVLLTHHHYQNKEGKMTNEKDGKE